MRDEVNLMDLQSSLPPIIARDRVEHLLGGIVSAKTLANLDSLGLGPKRLRIGRKIAYKTGDLLEWLSSRTMVLA
jgi:hypothetical protein